MASQHNGPNRNDKRYTRTEKLIRKAFGTLLKTMDVDKISVVAIAREAGINRKTFYLHYDSVDALVRQVASEQAMLLAQKLCQEVCDADAGGILLELETDMAGDLKDARSIINRIPLQQMISYLEQPLADAFFADDKFNLGSRTQSASYMVTFLVSGLLAMYRRWLADEDGIPMEDLAEVERFVVSSLHDSLNKQMPEPE